MGWWWWQNALLVLLLVEYLVQIPRRVPTALRLLVLQLQGVAALNTV